MSCTERFPSLICCTRLTIDAVEELYVVGAESVVRIWQVEMIDGEAKHKVPSHGQHDGAGDVGGVPLAPL